VLRRKESNAFKEIVSFAVSAKAELASGNSLCAFAPWRLRVEGFRPLNIEHRGIFKRHHESRSDTLNL